MKCKTKKCKGKGEIVEQERAKLIQEFIQDLKYLDKITNTSHVFQRIDEIKNKWESKEVKNAN